MTTRSSHPGAHPPHKARPHAKSRAAHRKRETAPKASRPASLWLFGVGTGLAVLAVAAVIFLFIHQAHARAAKAAELKKEADAGPRVLVRKVFKAPDRRTVTLPATARAYATATLYGKTAGYVKEVNTDKGRPVHKGDVLATISSPEVDRQVDSARATVLLQEQTAKRADFLSLSGVVSRQDRDTADANLRTARAALAQQLALQSYETIVAPFDGLCTARYVDPGALVSAATGSTQAAQPIVDVADPDQIRAQLYVGQDVAPFVRLGDPATLWQDERPADLISGMVTLASGALDETSRTELIEVQFDNRQVRMLPGTYVHIQLEVQSHGQVIAPVEALVVREGKAYVGVVGEDGRVKLQPVELGNNDGQQLEILSGVRGGEEVALNLPAEISDGNKIQPVRPKKPDEKGAEKADDKPRDGQVRAGANGIAEARQEQQPPSDANDQAGAGNVRNAPSGNNAQTGRTQGPRDQPGIQPPPPPPAQ